MCVNTFAPSTTHGIVCWAHVIFTPCFCGCVRSWRNCPLMETLILHPAGASSVWCIFVSQIAILGTHVRSVEATCVGEGSRMSAAAITYVPKCSISCGWESTAAFPIALALKLKVTAVNWNLSLTCGGGIQSFDLGINQNVIECLMSNTSDATWCVLVHGCLCMYTCVCMFSCPVWTHSR